MTGLLFTAVMYHRGGHYSDNDSRLLVYQDGAMENIHPVQHLKLSM
jgi:hypothetical protein